MKIWISFYRQLQHQLILNLTELIKTYSNNNLYFTSGTEVRKLSIGRSIISLSKITSIVVQSPIQPMIQEG